MREGVRREDSFGRAAEHYDLLYRDKDYAAEAAYALGEVRRVNPGARAVLDVGCGTGRHALELARLGCRVIGIDRSGTMLARARRRAASASRERRPAFRKADVRRLSLGRRFDAVVALFHVFSYLEDAPALAEALARIRAHLRSGGVLLFDCWHGPAVMSDPPRPRVRRALERGQAVERSTSIRLVPARRIVEVRQRFRARRKGEAADFVEVHRMRYWFRPEIENALGAAGFRLESAKEWRTGRRLGSETWCACFVARTA
ncbi:MAG: methyltransferase domain-containing protein [Elusimicrobiota bacterium]